MSDRERELTALVMLLAERLYVCFEILSKLAESQTPCERCKDGQFRKQPTPNWPTRLVCDNCGRIRV